MPTDICRAETGFAEAATLEPWNRMVRAFLSHRADAPEHLAAVLAREPQAPAALAAKGLFCLLLGRRETVAAAREAAGAAARSVAAGGACARARGWLAALECWLAGAPSGAVFHLETVLAHTPSDSLTVKLCHAMRFVMGDSGGMRRSLERVLPAHDADHPLSGYILGCHAFALEETGDYAAAERTGRAGLDRAADDAWGLHAVAHVCDMTRRTGDGLALIDRNRAAWDGCNNFRYHVWWHKALLHLDRGEADAVLDIYDTRMRAEPTDDYRDIANATSLLQRLELDGVSVGTRWAELADLAEARTGDGCLIFADLHYMLALMGDERPGAARRLAARIAADGRTGTEAARLADHPGRAVADGLAAFGEGRYEAAFALLSGARAHLPTIGGSHAQRDVFERITVDAGLRAGALDAVATILSDRTRLRAGRPDRFAETRMAALEAARRDGDPEQPQFAAQ